MKKIASLLMTAVLLMGVSAAAYDFQALAEKNLPDRFTDSLRRRRSALPAGAARG